MPRYYRFTFLCNQEELHAFTDLARKLKRSKSDTARFVLTEVAHQLSLTDSATIYIPLIVNPKGERRENNDSE